ncbi:MAG: hypothetical protein V1761_01830, partial [bacterium]
YADGVYYRSNGIIKIKTCQYHFKNAFMFSYGKFLIAKTKQHQFNNAFRFSYILFVASKLPMRTFHIVPFSLLDFPPPKQH